MPTVSLARLKEVLYLDEGCESGLRWKAERRSGVYMQFLCCEKDAVAGGFGEYWTLTVDAQTLLCHRIIMSLLLGVEPKDIGFVDHEDGNRRNNRVSNLRLSSPKFNSRNKVMSPLNKSGTTGVFAWEDKRRGTWAVRAQWYDADGKRCKKDFSVNLYGREEAWRLATELRNNSIALLNSQGAGYTKRHGESND